MPWKHLFKRSNTDSDPPPEPTTTRPPSPTLPPHMQRIVGERQRPDSAKPDAKTRLARLERNLMAAQFDIDQGELAIAPDNPWQQRMTLLTEAMRTVAEDVERARIVAPQPWVSLPATPIRITSVQADAPAEVVLAIGNEDFRYAEDRDWAERGHQMTQGELKLREGSIAHVVPQSDLAETIHRHLEESLFVFATDLRDRILDGEVLPDATLADLAKPCPVCGGFTDWKGRCQACRARNARMHELRREEDRLLSERGREAEEQHRLAERLPIARRRYRDIETEIAQVKTELDG
jgi:hypothetical protein